MKKIFACTLIALGCMAGTAQAASHGEVLFTGAVTDITCDIIPDVDGAAKNTVQLGTVLPNGLGDIINFKLAPKPIADECAGLAGKTAQISWTGSFTEAGLANNTGTAIGSVVELKTANAKDDPIQSMNTSDTSADWAGSTLLTDGAKFTAQLKAGAAAGDFNTGAAFVVAYK